MRAYLQQAGDLPAYLKSVGVDPAAAQAALNGKNPSAENVAASIDQWLKAIQAIRWAKSQARGRAARLRSRLGAAGRAPAAVNRTKGPGNEVAGAAVEPGPSVGTAAGEPGCVARSDSGTTAAPVLAPPVQSGATNASYAAKDSELWNDWDSGGSNDGIFQN